MLEAFALTNRFLSDDKEALYKMLESRIPDGASKWEGEDFLLALPDARVDIGGSFVYNSYQLIKLDSETTLSMILASDGDIERRWPPVIDRAIHNTLLKPGDEKLPGSTIIEAILPVTVKVRAYASSHAVGHPSLRRTKVWPSPDESVGPGLYEYRYEVDAYHYVDRLMHCPAASQLDTERYMKAAGYRKAASSYDSTAHDWLIDGEGAAVHCRECGMLGLVAMDVADFAGLKSGRSAFVLPRRVDLPDQEIGASFFGRLT